MQPATGVLFVMVANQCEALLTKVRGGCSLIDGGLSTIMKEDCLENIKIHIDFTKGRAVYCSQG